MSFHAFSGSIFGGSRSKSNHQDVEISFLFLAYKLSQQFREALVAFHLDELVVNVISYGYRFAQTYHL